MIGLSQRGKVSKRIGHSGLNQRADNKIYQRKEAKKGDVPIAKLRELFKKVKFNRR